MTDKSESSVNSVNQRHVAFKLPRTPVRWSFLAPRIALIPAGVFVLVTFVVSISWTLYLSFTASKRIPDYTLVGLRQYQRLFSDENWFTSLKNLLYFGVGSIASIVIGFILAAIIDREARGAPIFRTIFLYPLSISLIVTGIAWRWLFDPNFGMDHFLRQMGLGWINFHWLAAPETVMAGITLASVWQNTGFFMALLLAGLKGVNPEIWRAGQLDGVPFWRFYLEIIVPMLKFTFVSCAILLAINVVKAYDIVVSMTHGGPGSSSYLPAYFTIGAYWERSNLAYGSAAATIMLLMTMAAFIPLVVYQAWKVRSS